MEIKITTYCSIKDNQVTVNGKSIYTSEEIGDFSAFIKDVYKHFELNYPKFYKMDPLCKLSVATSSIMIDRHKEPAEDMALLLSNKSSCIDIDLIHQESISQGEESYASPATFVYTLPNIALGEISIKYKLRSENSFFIFESFNPDFLVDYTTALMNTGKASSVLCGWVEVNGNDYNAFMCIAEREGLMELTRENLLKLL